MSDQRSRGARGTDDALAIMNDHLARFFEHADGLLREWQVYGDELRATLDAQARDLQATVTRAVTDAGQAAAQRLDQQINTAVAESVQSGLAGVRQELDGLSRLARQTTTRVQTAMSEAPDTADARPAPGARAPRRGKRDGARTGSRPVMAYLLALTTANVMLAALLVMNTRGCRGSGDEARPGEAAILQPGAGHAGGPGGQPGASTAQDGSAHDRAAALCQELAAGRDEDSEDSSEDKRTDEGVRDAARAFIGAAAEALCDEETAVKATEALLSHLEDDASEAAPPDAGKGDAGKARGDAGKSKSDTGKARSKSDTDKDTSKADRKPQTTDQKRGARPEPRRGAE